LLDVPVMDAALNGDDPASYMLKAAVLRRHLTDDQRAAMAVLWSQENKAQGKRTDLTSGERQPQVLRRQAAADLHRVSQTCVRRRTHRRAGARGLFQFAGKPRSSHPGRIASKFPYTSCIGAPA